LPHLAVAFILATKPHPTLETYLNSYQKNLNFLSLFFLNTLGREIGLKGFFVWGLHGLTAVLAGYRFLRLASKGAGALWAEGYLGFGVCLAF